MRGWPITILMLSIVACSSDNTGPVGNPPAVPVGLISTTLDGAIALSWSDNAYAADPANFQDYQIYSTSYDLASDQCGTDWSVEGTTVAPEFLVGALTNGVSSCFAVSATSQGGAESGRSDVRHDTPRPDARNIVLFARQAQNAGSGFRFWKDRNVDRQAQDSELGLVLPGSDSTIDFSVERDGTGALFLSPVRQGTGVEFYADLPVDDLTSVDLAPCLQSSGPASCARYTTTPIEASPGFGYVFELESDDPSDPYLRYGAVRVTHVGRTYLILDWSFQTDPGNPELMVGHHAGVRERAANAGG